MPIVLVRVDDRLIHGQIIEGWLPVTKAEELIIADDALAQDSLQQMIMLSALPLSVGLMVDTVDAVACFLQDNRRDHVRRIVLVRSPRDALRLMRAGVQFDHLNVGNLMSREVAVCLGRSVMVSMECLMDLNSIIQEGVRVTIQTVPFEKPDELLDLKRFFLNHEIV
uniref:PTS mannose/fructose/sorbose transporter subunit IIB n=1 Tax=Desulfomonile tiedjei TaxID=2358 RepID=A0A7C4EVU8_9BACT